MSGANSNNMDEGGNLVKERFTIFLHQFKPKVLIKMQEKLSELADTSAPLDYSQAQANIEDELTSSQRLTYDYLAQISNMIQNNTTTLFVNFQHISDYDNELAEAIELEFYRFEPFLRLAVEEIIKDDAPSHIYQQGADGSTDTGPKREIFVSFYGMPRVETVRSMNTAKLGKLMSISGTVTRSSEVRPELMFATFQCCKCGHIHDRVEQQFQLTHPPRCLRDQCGAHNFELIIPASTFVDWQRLKVQENADEIPPGSMPRSIDIICRNELVELAKAGDKVIFSGFVAVVPDGGGLARVGESTTVAPERGMSDGVTGLRALGVREMTYKLIFLACSVIQSEKYMLNRYRLNGPLEDGSIETIMSNIRKQQEQQSTDGNDNNSSSDNNNNSSSSNIPGAAGAGEFNGGAYGELSEEEAAALNDVLHNRLSPASQLIGTVHIPSLSEVGGLNTNANHDDRDTNIDLTETDKTIIKNMLETPQLYQNMTESICPGVFGHLEVKRGILLMLLGGVHKRTPEGISLRGDLNVCIVGDPSCAKSQFLKYVHGFLPRTVYTSGKSSSAAGLTASVIRDSDTGEFCVEAGALMLADNGICCIDEFDKMDPTDQVAIHEAMEQQTISITKAGIQATLNARTSILAAANPVSGRYDRGKPLRSNVSISAPIMSRFDLFFVIIDECQPSIDEQIARHIVDNHRAGGRRKREKNAPFSVEELQRYIRFARTINPLLTPEAKKVLVESYRMLRQNDLVGKNKTSYRITVRQLESLVRLSEALARVHLDHYVQAVYVKEAYRLLQKSIIFVESEDIELGENEVEMDQLEKNRQSMDVLEGIVPPDDEDGSDDGFPDADGHDHDHDDNDQGPEGGNGREATGGDENMSPQRNNADFDGYEESKGSPGSGTKRKADDKEQITNAASTSGEGETVPEADVVQVQEKKRTKKTKVKMNAQEYNSISTVVKLYLLRLAEHPSETPVNSLALASAVEDKEGVEESKDGEPPQDETQTQTQVYNPDAPPVEAPADAMSVQDEAAEKGGDSQATQPLALSSIQTFPGILWTDLLDWMLTQEQQAQSLNTVQELEDRRKVLSLVVKRMLRQEGSIMEVGTHDMDYEGKVLKLHPSINDFNL